MMAWTFSLRAVCMLVHAHPPRRTVDGFRKSHLMAVNFFALGIYRAIAPAVGRDVDKLCTEHYLRRTHGCTHARWAQPGTSPGTHTTQ